MFVTTAGRTNPEMVTQAKRIADELTVMYIKREKRSIKDLQLQHGDECLVVGKNRLELHKIGKVEPFFFHPNIAMLRLKRLLQGEQDPYLAAAGIKEGSKILDCTLGLGSDAIVASFAAGETGSVLAIEADPAISCIVRNGLNQWQDAQPEIQEAMKRIEIRTGHHLNLLKAMPDHSFDVVYFDPMFEESVLESDGIRGLTHFASRENLTEETLVEAKRVAVSRVVLKDHFRSTRFSQFGFTVIKRKTSVFHYGYIEKNTN